ncbi:alpha-L-fucosidase [Pararhizobium sp.]|uniref:alpha-L-fucosidase n=1 Tax=Pararhizobium sp. TaxID=1977563 RepID=UPI0027223BA2|nr:alpha-L-fucosidase [Pararhizobium sp.]MDO9417084.1 alpha-L-fucosidase [Pararhizobium sp.]
MNERVSKTGLAVPDGKVWFDWARFGMFIHFGLYALGARHEWLKSKEEMTTETYAKYFEHFDPDLYDPKDWARKARESGMKYVVLTAKHHDGFCLWDSKFTDYKATRTPYGADLLGPFVEAFRAEGLKVGFYYSLLDWHHPDFTIDRHHPQRNHPDVASLNAGRDGARYAAYMRDQVTELLTGFGKIDIIWFDFSYPHRPYKGLPGKGRDDWESEELITLVRHLQSDIIVGDRLDLPTDGNHPKDLATPEQYTPRIAPTLDGKPVRWEVCHTMGGAWGYHRDEESWKDAAQLINLLIDAVSLGGNLLMNVGPNGRGAFDGRAERALVIYRTWMDLNARSIHGAGASRFVAPNGCKFTQSRNRLYLHIQTWPFRHIHIERLAGKVKYAQFLHDASEVQWLDPVLQSEGDNMSVVGGEGILTLELPVRRPEVVVPVIELILEA